MLFLTRICALWGVKFVAYICGLCECKTWQICGMVMVATIALICGRQFGTKESLARPDLIGLFAHLLLSPMQWESPILILFRCARLLESLAYRYRDQVTIDCHGTQVFRDIPSEKTYLWCVEVWKSGVHTSTLWTAGNLRSGASPEIKVGLPDSQFAGFRCF